MATEREREKEVELEQEVCQLRHKATQSDRQGNKIIQKYIKNEQEDVKKQNTETSEEVGK